MKALKWEELQEMEGKPIWIENIGYSCSGFPCLWRRWGIIQYVEEDHMRVISDLSSDLNVYEEYFSKKNLFGMDDAHMDDDHVSTWMAFDEEREYDAQIHELIMRK